MMSLTQTSMRNLNKKFVAIYFPNKNKTLIVIAKFSQLLMLSYTSLRQPKFCFHFLATNKQVQEQSIRSAPVTNLKPPPAEQTTVEKAYGKDGSIKRPKLPITANSYTVASLQTATNSFSQESLIGEGSLGRVYRAEFSNGKVGNNLLLAIKFYLCLFHYNLKSYDGQELGITTPQLSCNLIIIVAHRCTILGFL